MWLILAFVSAAIHGCYDICKKRALLNNAVLPVLFFNTLFSALIFLPLILSSIFGWGIGEGTLFEVPSLGWEAHKHHYEALREYGPSEIHRLSFLKKMH